MVKNNINNLKDAKEELHLVVEEMKKIRKKFSIRKRARDVSAFRHMISNIRYFHQKVKVGNRHIESYQLRFLHLIKNKAWLKGYISAKMKLKPRNKIFRKESLRVLNN